MSTKLYTVGDIAQKLGIKTARAAYILRTLAEEGKVTPVVETTNTKFYDEETIKLARQKNKTVR